MKEAPPSNKLGANWSSQGHRKQETSHAKNWSWNHQHRVWERKQEPWNKKQIVEWGDNNSHGPHVDSQEHPPSRVWIGRGSDRTVTDHHFIDRENHGRGPNREVSHVSRPYDRMGYQDHDTTGYQGHRGQSHGGDNHTRDSRSASSHGIRHDGGGSREYGRTDHQGTKPPSYDTSSASYEHPAFKSLITNPDLDKENLRRHPHHDTLYGLTVDAGRSQTTPDDPRRAQNGSDSSNPLCANGYGIHHGSSEDSQSAWTTRGDPVVTNNDCGMQKDMSWSDFKKDQYEKNVHWEKEVERRWI